MLKILEPYILTFIPIFVAVDAIGNIPVFISLVEGVSKKQRRKVITESVTTATALAIFFMLVGKLVLRFIGITIADFQIAGGALLFIISMRLLLPGSQKMAITDGHDKDVGVFPLGTPLITGPAVLATTLIMLDSYGIGATFVSLILNMFVVWVTLAKAELIIKFIGASGTRAFSKIMYIFLAAIGVMMIRRGLEMFFVQ
ncbi:MAG: MarC family protein [Candidatus Omnitrophica bacterium]|nr:MarC family protein [Candidatus Omnitrophota bacterium]MDD5553525.1 MarC family protein [Candidatus Omnitrophota bacterium]